MGLIIVNRMNLPICQDERISKHKSKDALTKQDPESHTYFMTSEGISQRTKVMH